MSKGMDMNSPVMGTMFKLSDLVIVNVIYIMCCIPIFTIGAATTALYYTTLKLVEDRGSSAVKAFFHSFKQNFRQATTIWVLCLLLGAILGADFYILNMVGSDSYPVVRVLLIVPAIVMLFTMTYVFPVLSRFDNTIKRTIINAFLLSVINFPKTILMILLNVIPFAICVFSLRLLPVTALVGFTGIAYINCMMFLKIFEKIMTKDETEEEEGVEDSFEFFVKKQEGESLSETKDED